MKLIKSMVAAFLAIFTMAATPAAALVWAPPPAWGPGWHHWVGHHPVACGWHWAGPHARVWRCY